MNTEFALPPYLVQSGLTMPLVEAWSMAALPFEPKGWPVQLRRELRQSLSRLSTAGGVLHGVYGTAARSRHAADVENLLFYNVGSASFKQCDGHGLRFERAASATPSPLSIDGPALHYYRYAIADQGAGFRHWQEGPAVARWNDVPVPQPSTMTASRIWQAFRTSPAGMHNGLQEQEPFGLSLVLSVPRGAAVHLTKLVKPLLDGLIANFHAHDSTKTEVVASRVAAHLEMDPMQIAHLLSDQCRAVLGRRCLVVPRDKGVQWQPEDDRCLATEIAVRTGMSADWRCSGRMFGLVAGANTGPVDGPRT